jgi:5-methyltetrahydropteroyltriglutamate--homocysteine methyltransferase
MTQTHRILTTHAGSLPRGDALVGLLLAQERGEAIDGAELEAVSEAAVDDVISRQIAAGVDIVNDGEQLRTGFTTYLPHRMTGFGGKSKRRMPTDYVKFPRYRRLMENRFPHLGSISAGAPQALAELQYVDGEQAQRDCERVTRRLSGRAEPVQGFMTAPSPGIIATTMLNAFYDSHERYVFALARELAKEYAIVHRAGLILQIDAPDLAMERTTFFQDVSDAEFVKNIEIHVAALNRALEGIPRDRVRLHCCWGCREGPHVDDVALELVLPVLYQARVSALSLEFANPRHQHEYQAFAEYPLPSEFTLIPGVIDNTTNFVEHPQVIATRILEAIAAVGDPIRVIAGVDCGFNTFLGYDQVASDVVWEKLASARRGADLAARQL